MLSIGILGILILLATASFCFAADGPWLGKGPGTVTVSDGASSSPSLHYEWKGKYSELGQWWQLYTTATSTRTVTMLWEYSGNHGCLSSGEIVIQAFVERDGIVKAETIIDERTWCSFSLWGAYPFNLQPGDVYGFRLGGWSKIEGYLTGTLAVHGPWLGTGPGAITVSSRLNHSESSLHYELSGEIDWSGRWWKFYTTATSTRTVTVGWEYSGHHAWNGAWASLVVFVERGGVLQEVTIKDGPASGGFGYSGIYQFDVQAGDIYGFLFGGANDDSVSFLRGTLVVRTIRVYLPLIRSGV